jgi:hypothetical protein
MASCVPLGLPCLDHLCCLRYTGAPHTSRSFLAEGEGDDVDLEDDEAGADTGRRGAKGAKVSWLHFALVWLRPCVLCARSCMCMCMHVW